jgi:hypothetical protein
LTLSEKHDGKLWNDKGGRKLVFYFIIFLSMLLQEIGFFFDEMKGKCVNGEFRWLVCGLWAQAT